VSDVYRDNAAAWERLNKLEKENAELKKRVGDRLDTALGAGLGGALVFVVLLFLITLVAMLTDWRHVAVCHRASQWGNSDSWTCQGMK
jgi:hypothetical protein